MNQTQIKYVRERLKTLYDMKRRKIDSDYAYNKLPSMTLEQKIDDIQKGKFMLRPGVEMSSVAPIETCIKFREEDERATFYEEGKQKKERLLAEYNRILDELILGDAQKAVDALKDFTNFE